MDADEIIYEACINASKMSNRAFIVFLESRGIRVDEATFEEFANTYYNHDYTSPSEEAPPASTPVQKQPTRNRIKKQKVQPNTMAHGVSV